MTDKAHRNGLRDNVYTVRHAMRLRPDYWYEQSAVIPYRRGKEGLEVLMITSRKKRRWVVPKGIREPDLSAAASAAKEALEEAGVEGQVAARAMGSYHYRKWGGTCDVEVYAMEVRTVHEAWDESFRDREWVPLKQAAARVEEDGLKRIIHLLPSFLEQR